MENKNYFINVYTYDRFNKLNANGLNEQYVKIGNFASLEEAKKEVKNIEKSIKEDIEAHENGLKNSHFENVWQIFLTIDDENDESFYNNTLIVGSEEE